MMSRLIIAMIISFSLLSGCAGNETNEGISVDYEPLPVIDDPYRNNNPNDTRLDFRGEGLLNRNFFESVPDTRPGVGTREERDGDSVKNSLNPQEMTDHVVELTNQVREQHGLQPLEIDPRLTSVAQEKSRDMAENAYFSHTSPTYGSPFDMMSDFGITYRVALENIAAGQGSAEEVVDQWMNSPSHRENILNEDVTHIGVGYYVGGPMSIYWTQMFIEI